MNHLLLILSIVVVVFLSQWNFCDSFKANVCDKLGLFFGFREELYSCVIECGDYKCQLVCYSFIPSKNGRNIRLNEIFYRRTNATVQSFAHDSLMFMYAIDYMLDEARQHIPQALWQQSPLILVGTSCFRQVVTKDELDRMEPELNRLLGGTGFLVQKQSVIVCNDRNEGLFNWFTVNLMLGRLSGVQSNTVAMLNLDISSNQVTFVASAEQLRCGKYRGYITTEEFGTKNNFQIYSRGFPELGIGEVRKKVIEMGTFEGGVYYTECISPSFGGYWTYKGITYRLSGSRKTTLKSKVPNYPERGVDIEKCESAVRQVLFPLPEVPSLTGRQIYGLNSYFRTFATAGLVDLVRGGSFSMADLYNAVKDTCKQTKLIVEFLCMDLMYITVLLQDFYGLRPKDTIYVGCAAYNTQYKTSCTYLCCCLVLQLTDNIKEHEVQKTLGIAYLNMVSHMRKER
ncbi:hypothetical protein RUM44_008232 [Polyplax serrata]|uniref:Uncharacterized protein n=1 Tax=Polyplax serrata TaxID=468196 RepID=A0ABR1BC56_POLSC